MIPVVFKNFLPMRFAAKVRNEFTSEFTQIQWVMVEKRHRSWSRWR